MLQRLNTFDLKALWQVEPVIWMLNSINQVISIDPF